jgi:predicted CoA-binding protein
LDQGTIDEFLGSRVFAVVGVSTNKEKYGYQVYEDLKEGGFKVYPVNRLYEEIFGDRCYADLQSLPEKPDVVNFVCPPGVTESFVKTMPGLGIDKAWMQPGAESNEAIQFCRDNNIKVLHDICVMIERRKK